MLLCAPLYMLHETEEYLFPGGFVEFMNHDLYKQDPETGMVDERLVYWINMGYIWLPLPVCGLLATYDLRLAAWMPYFLIFQAVVHIGLSIAARRWYNPGLATACLACSFRCVGHRPFERCRGYSEPLFQCLPADWLHLHPWLTRHGLLRDEALPKTQFTICLKLNNGK
jgi:hypothetical protein